MAKNIIPNKVIINYNNDGTFRDGVIQYRVEADGALDNNFKTISIDNAGFSIPQFNAALAKIKDKAIISEKADGHEKLSGSINK